MNEEEKKEEYVKGVIRKVKTEIEEMTDWKIQLTCQKLEKIGGGKV